MIEAYFQDGTLPEEETLRLGIQDNHLELKPYFQKEKKYGNEKFDMEEHGGVPGLYFCVTPTFHKAADRYGLPNFSPYGKMRIFAELGSLPLAGRAAIIFQTIPFVSLTRTRLETSNMQ